MFLLSVVLPGFVLLYFVLFAFSELYLVCVFFTPRATLPNVAKRSI